MEAGTDSTLPEYGLREIVHTLAQSLREYRKYAWETPLLVAFEAIIECTIPFFTAQLMPIIPCVLSLEKFTIASASSRYDVYSNSCAEYACGKCAVLCATFLLSFTPSRSSSAMPVAA